MSTPAPTQVKYPWKATLRTVVQVGIPTVLTLCVVIPQVIDAILDGFGEQLPPEFVGWMLGASALVTTLAGVLARIMAIPAVNAVLTKIGLGARPAPAE